MPALALPSPSSELADHEIDMFRALKKTAIVLILMLRLDRPVGEKEISEILEINLATARTYVHDLAEEGLVIRHGRYNGWHLTAGGRQMVLPIDFPRIGNAENSRSSAENSRSSAENSRSSAENSRSRRQLINNNNLKTLNQETVIVVENGSAKKPRSSAKKPRSPLWKTMKTEGILARICDQLSARPEITLEHVQNWAAKLKAQKGDKYTPGLLVAVLKEIEPGDPPPPKPESLIDQDRYKYITGEFAEFIEH